MTVLHKSLQFLFSLAGFITYLKNSFKRMILAKYSIVCVDFVLLVLNWKGFKSNVCSICKLVSSMSNK